MLTQQENDFLTQTGAGTPMGVDKSLRAQAIALENKLPYVQLIESAGGNLLRRRVLRGREDAAVDRRPKVPGIERRAEVAPDPLDDVGDLAAGAGIGDVVEPHSRILPNAVSGPAGDPPLCRHVAGSGHDRNGSRART